MTTLFLKISQEGYESIPKQYRLLFELLTVEPDDYNELFKDDNEFMKLSKAKKKASKEFLEYKFNKRNK